MQEIRAHERDVAHLVAHARDIQPHPDQSLGHCQFAAILRRELIDRRLNAGAVQQLFKLNEIALGALEFDLRLL